MSSSDEEEERRRGRASDAGDSGSEGGGGGATRERSATYAGSKCMELLGLLRSAKHAGRIKALRRFQDYVQRYKPEFYDDDVELLLVVREKKQRGLLLMSLVSLCVVLHQNQTPLANRS